MNIKYTVNKDTNANRQHLFQLGIPILEEYYEQTARYSEKEKVAKRVIIIDL